MMTLLSYFGAVCGVLAAVSMLLHVTKLDETKYGKLFCTLSNDVIGVYKGLTGVSSAPK